MGQTPSCIQPLNLPQKEPKLVAAYPDSQSMASPRQRRSTQMQSISSTASMKSTSQSTSNYSTDYQTPSPSNTPVKRPLKALVVDDTETPASSARSLMGWLKEKRAHNNKQPDYMLETPKGAQANEFKHFCPICYRYFRSIYSTSCCAGNCCHECATNFISTRTVGLKFHPNVELDLPCPNCNQTNGVAFVALTQEDDSKLYIESPRTQALLEQAQSRQRQEEVDQRPQISA